MNWKTLAILLLLTSCKMAPVHDIDSPDYIFVLDKNGDQEWVLGDMGIATEGSVIPVFNYWIYEPGQDRELFTLLVGIEQTDGKVIVRNIHVTKGDLQQEIDKNQLLALLERISAESLRMQRELSQLKEWVRKSK